MSANDDTQPPRVQPPGKRRRVFLWVFLTIQVVFLGWVIYAGVSAPQSGRSPGVGLQVGLWAVADVILGAVYLIGQLPRGPR
jgi:asparagine N-glycosylation enzyme membrane subunit Stt3